MRVVDQLLHSRQHKSSHTISSRITRSRARPLRIIAVVATALAMTIPTIANATVRTNIEPYGGPKANGQHTLLVIGDSLTDGARAFGGLQTRLEKLPMWSKVIIDSRWGRRGPEGITVLRRHLEKNQNITAVVFALGTNDLLSRRQKTYPRELIAAYNNEFGHIPTLWIDAQYSANHPDWNMRARRFSRVIANVSASRDTMHHASWFQNFQRTSPWYQFDGVHLSPRGYRMRSDFIVKQARVFGRTVILSTTTTTTPETTTPESTVPESTSTTSTSPPDTSDPNPSE
jgi:lysophospholipase L1-like esterase